MQTTKRYYIIVPDLIFSSVPLGTKIWFRTHPWVPKAESAAAAPPSEAASGASASANEGPAQKQNQKEKSVFGGHDGCSVCNMTTNRRCNACHAVVCRNCLDVHRLGCPDQRRSQFCVRCKGTPAFCCPRCGIPFCAMHANHDCEYAEASGRLNKVPGSTQRRFVAGCLSNSSSRRTRSNSGNTQPKRRRIHFKIRHRSLAGGDRCRLEGLIRTSRNR